ncbi:hypothetical protein QL285_059016 [Trifolium repens]|nr:hypothetical protein QL285_059016 [Trifolium repens]
MKKQVDLRQSPSVSVGFLNLQQHVDFSIFLLLLELTSLSLNFLSWLLLQPLLLSSSFSPLESSKMSVVRKIFCEANELNVPFLEHIRS